MNKEKLIEVIHRNWENDDEVGLYKDISDLLDTQRAEIIKLIEDTPCPPNIHAMAFKQKIINVIQDNE